MAEKYYTYGQQQAQPADVSYSLPRIAQEAGSEVSPNAVDVGGVWGFTQVNDGELRDAAYSAAPSATLGVKPAALVVGKGDSAKTVVEQAQASGMRAYVCVGKNRRRYAATKVADGVVELGESAQDALVRNACAVLRAASQINAQTILLCEDSATLGIDQVFLHRAAEQGAKVYKVLPLFGQDWVLCQPDDRQLPPARWMRCAKCGLSFDAAALKDEGYACPSCGTLMRIGSAERLDMVLDPGTFQEWDERMPESDPLQFPGYPEKLQANRDKSGCDEAIRIGRGRIGGLPVAIGVMEPAFLMGSMGHVVGQKVCDLVDRATEERLPVVIFCASGGARMQEGLVSLMQMAKVSCAFERHSRAGLLYVSVCTDPTTGGVTASFAMQGDIILSEPGALIGFAGQRVIRDTIRQELPEGFQTAEFALEHGLIDAIVERPRMRSALMRILMMHARVEDLTDVDDAALEDARGASGVGSTVAERLAAAAAEHGFEPVTLPSSPVAALRDRLGSLGVVKSVREGALGSGGHRKKAARAAGVVESEEQQRQADLLAVRAARKLRRKLGSEGEAGSTQAWECVQRARNVHRPTSRAYVEGVFDDFFELHGDRMFADDGAILAGVGLIAGQPVTVIGQEKGVDLNDRIKRNFGCPQPEGYRKALRLMRQAEKFGRPIVCLVDTQGAFCGMEAEERGQGNALADNLIGMAALRVPVVSVFLGEGGSGGALALAVANEVAIQENAVYSVLSPEGFASILWKDRSRAAEAAQVMGMCAADVAQLGVADVVLSEGDGPAHENPDQAVAHVREYVEGALERLGQLSPDELVAQRQERFAQF
ncbi:MAG: acetyl-CoA carboxylase, carboxyltransferase subunit beta [Coriobacteriia bacterium]|nr:acetyl-CoA carboxylase, carboxyltransferase subunit beta [Coriobacteriia bacterium]